MKVIIANTLHFREGGASNYCFHLADLLRSHHHEVCFFAMQDIDNLPDPNSDLFVSFINYRSLNQKKNIKNGLQVLSRAIYSTEARRKFSLLVDRVKPDIIHLQNIHAHITPSIILEAQKRGIPVVWTLHDYKLICPNSHFLIDQTSEICEACRGGNFWRATQKRCKKGSVLASGMASLEAYAHQLINIRQMVDAYLCPSNFLRQKLLENGYPLAKTHHLPLFLPAENFQHSEQDDGYLLFLGKLEPLKGIFPLVEAARLAPQVKLILAGRAEEAVLSQLGELPPNVKYVGFQSGRALDELRQKARAVVLPSIWYENQPLSILEAFALGKPVIASDLGGMSELVGNNERGLLVPPGNANELAIALKWTIENPLNAQAIGDRAYNYATNIHAPDVHYQKMVELYQSL